MVFFIFYFSLWLLHGTVDPKLPARFQLYSDIIDVAKRNKQLLLVYGGIDSLNKSLLSISHSKKQKQSLLRQLHSALIENGHRSDFLTTGYLHTVFLFISKLN